MVVAPRGSTHPIPSAMIERIGIKWRMMIVVHGMIRLTMCHTGTVTFEGCCG
jgi:hypothetical protein